MTMRSTDASRRAWASLVMLITCGASAGLAFAGPAIVHDGRARAEIVIAEKPPRTVKLAARELQTYIEKISGAKLAIVSKPTDRVPVKAYVGRSAYTDRLGVRDDGLKYGAFRMKSGDNWLVLLGHDEDFTPKEPYARSRRDIPRVMKEWDARTGAKWGNPIGPRTIRYFSPKVGLWEGDRRGSLNAVCEFLRSLGVRWYMPGELGEVVPRMRTLALPKVDKASRPDYPLRYLYFAFYHVAPKEDILWYLRLGLNHGKETLGPAPVGHGGRAVHSRAEMKKAHPEYYALWGGKRQTEKKGAGVPCLSAEGLLKENVRFARADFDIYGAPHVSVMPQDGYATMCQCALCKGKGTPGRGWYGAMSDYVWAYVDRVAREVYETHPSKWISCFAYGTYLLPPEKIAKFGPNVVVGIVHDRASLQDPEIWDRYVKTVRGWREKLTSGKLLRAVHYLRSVPRSAWHGLPVYYPRAIAKDLRFLKGVALGGFNEVSFDRGRRRLGGLHVPAFNHLNIYVTARLYWDADQDLDAILNDYYEKFYGPAAKEMKAFIEYSEANWRHMRTKVEPIDKALALLKAARKAAGDSVYGKRIALLADYLAPMAGLRARLREGRKNVPVAVALGRKADEVKVDGKLDDKFWKRQRTYGLRELQTGREPSARTTFQVGWAGNALYFAVRCEDRDMKGLKVTATKDGDTNIWMGDCVELLIETQCHSYYQIAVNPAGAVMDLDRKGRFNTQWSSGVEVATHRGEDFWSVEARVPLTGDMKGSPDPLNGVAGGRPTSTFPFFFNVCRQRIRGEDVEGSAFSPTGKNSFHNVAKFGKLYVK